MAVRPVPTYEMVDAASTDARAALARYFGELETRFVGGFDAEQALAEAVDTLNPPAGMFVVVRLDDVLVGCGALQWIDEDTAEIKRMWVDAGQRGMGLGKQLLAHLEVVAREAGRSRVVLDTNSALTEARAMYQALGYFAIERYNDNPYAHHWFAKDLAPARTDS